MTVLKTYAMHYLTLFMILICSVTAWSAGAAEKTDGAPVAFDTTKRVMWTTSRVRGAPEPPSAYTTQRLYANITFDSPVDLQLSPDKKNWYVCLRNAEILTFPVDKPESATTLIALGNKQLPGHLRGSTYSLTFHPQFATNGYIYVFFKEPRPDPGHSYVIRYTIKNNEAGIPAIVKNSECQIMRWPCGQDHFGGCLQFGNDGYLYISVGDGSFYGDHHESGQNLSDYHASILRIDVDKVSLGKSYSVPVDNPFITLHGAQPEIWAYGLRNIWKMSFDRVTGALWGCDVGQDLWDTVVCIERGDNYGWSVMEGSYSFRPERKVGPTPITKPLVDHGHFEARSLTGGFVYRGKAFPALTGAYIYGDFDTGKIWAVRAEKNTVTWHQEILDTPLRIVGFAEDADQELILIHFSGELHRLIAQDPAVLAEAAKHHFPNKLSETGLFSDTAQNQVAPGVIPYSVNSPLWSDNAQKERYIAIPGDGKINHNRRLGWEFPDGTVLVKTFALDIITGDKSSRKRLETRLLHREESHWRGYTYVWNDEQTDAVLLDNPKGLDRDYVITEKNGDERKQTWHFPGRAECTLCHTMPLNFVLGPSTAQMNRLHDYGNGVVENQLSVFEKIGLLEKKLPEAGPASLEKMADPKDESATIEARARAYLHANCAHCHAKWGGGNAFFYLLHNLTLNETNTLDVAPQHGDLGVPGAKVIAPGSPQQSLIYLRMMRLGHERMPRIASSVIDETGTAIVAEWIESLKQ